MAPILQDDRGHDPCPVGPLCHCWPRNHYPCHIIPRLQRKNICMAGASGRKMEESTRRLADPLGNDVCHRLSPGNRLFDLPDARWLCLRLSMGLANRRFCHDSRIYVLIHRLPNAAFQFRQSTCSERQKIRSAVPRPETRRPEASSDDQTLPSSLQHLERSHIHFSYRATTYVRRRDCCRDT